MSKKQKKWLKMAQNVHGLCQPTPKPRTGRIYAGYAAQIKIPRAPSPPHPPTFCHFHPLESPNETSTPPYHWSLGGARGQPGPHMVGANGRSTGVPRAKKFFVPRTLGMLKQVFLAHFEPMATPYSPCKIPKCLENGLFWDQKGVQNGSKMCFSENDPMTKKVSKLGQKRVLQN